MILAPLFVLVLSLVHIPLILAQGLQDPTLLVGTWSSGAKNVRTGPGFANPQNKTFQYPATTGISYSFTADGFYEIARYRFNGNGSQPTCITGVANWVHGKYALNPNGSMTFTPLPDGYQQIQDPCAAVSNFIEDYDLVELYADWKIFNDPLTGLKLHLFQFDGAPLNPMFQISTTPSMLPTQLLRNVTKTPQPETVDGFTTQKTLLATNSAPLQVGAWSSLGFSTLAGLVVLSVSLL
jgi:hypothetical protein